MLFLFLACWAKGQDTGENAQEEFGCGERNTHVTIGSGEFEWEDLTANDEVVMVHGPQGGWHMLGSIRLSGSEQIVEIDYTIRDIASNVIVSDNHYRVALVMDGECQGYYPGMYGYLNVTDLAVGDLDTPPELLAQNTLEMVMKANDCPVSKDEQGLCSRDERWAENSISVLAVKDPIDID